MKRSDTSFFKKATSPILPNPPYLWEEKSEAPPPPHPTPPSTPSPFLKILKTQSSLIKWEGGSNYASAFLS